MAPKYKIEECRDLAVEDTLPLGCAQKVTFKLVLMEHQDVEPAVFVLSRPLELDVL